MWPLIGFIVMALVVLTLIEINERIKAKKSKDPTEHSEKSHQSKNEDCTEACTDCSLLDVCEKKVH